MWRVARSLLFLVSLAAIAAEAPKGCLVLAATIGPIDAGVVPALAKAFEKESGIQVHVIGLGTGAALDLARRGEADLAMVHAPALEEKFIKDGFGTERVPLMYNDFVILGPAADPAGIRKATSAAALKAIAAKGAPFLSRGDRSGTHVAELELWAKAGLQPAGTWYRVFERGTQGNKPTLLEADRLQAYTVIDRATWVTLKGQLTLQVMVEGDEALLNHISLVPVDVKRFPAIRAAEAAAFVAWLTDPGKGQRLIQAFGRERFGQALFFPESRAWMAHTPRQP
jgi:tungstate transport system substrate-binding protein